MENKPCLLDQVREQICLRHYSIRTERVYCEWVRRFIRSHQYRHPMEMGATEVEAFLSDLAVMIYTHVLNRGTLGILSPLDRY